MSLSLRSLLATALVAVATTASAQTTVFSENFESTSGSSLPAGWLVIPFGGTVGTTDNPYTGGANTSSRALSLTGAGLNIGVGELAAYNLVVSPVIDLSAYFTGSGNTATANPGVSLTLTLSGAYNANYAQRLAIGFADVNGSTEEWYAAYTNWNNQPFTVTNFGNNAAGAGNWWSATLSDLQNTIPSGSFNPSTFRLIIAHLDGANPAFNYGTVFVDNVTLTAAVPEPATYAAWAGLAALGLALWRRRSLA